MYLQVFFIIALSNCPSLGEIIRPLTAGIDDIIAATASGIPCTAIVRSYLNRIANFNPRLNLMLSLHPAVLSLAEAADALRASGRPLGPLHCIPVIISDNFDFNGTVTTVGSSALSDNVASRDSYVASVIKQSGAILIGSGNMAEWGMCSEKSISSLGGLAKNPFDAMRSTYGPQGKTFSL